MNRKISRNEKHKYSNEEKLKVGLCWKQKHKRSNKYFPGGWQQHFWIVTQNVGINNLRSIILKCPRFCLIVTFVFILLLLYTQMVLIL